MRDSICTVVVVVVPVESCSAAHTYWLDTGWTLAGHCWTGIPSIPGSAPGLLGILRHTLEDASPFPATSQASLLTGPPQLIYGVKQAERGRRKETPFRNIAMLRVNNLPNSVDEYAFGCGVDSDSCQWRVAEEGDRRGPTSVQEARPKRRPSWGKSK